jgi:hypothetical protein
MAVSDSTKTEPLHSINLTQHPANQHQHFTRELSFLFEGGTRFLFAKISDEQKIENDLHLNECKFEQSFTVMF